MGTRNLTMVIKNDKPLIAQYGQWDGYPDGQGKTFLNFISNVDLESFVEKLKNKVRFFNGRDLKEEMEFSKSIGSNSGMLDMNQAELYNEKYPYLSRDIGAEILEKIYNSNDDDILLNDSSSFGYDTVFCEWAYILNLDTEEMEIYCSYESYKNNVYDLKDNWFHRNKGNYYHSEGYVDLIKKFHLRDLPTTEYFIEYFNNLQNEDDEE